MLLLLLLLLLLRRPQRPRPLPLPLLSEAFVSPCSAHELMPVSGMRRGRSVIDGGTFPPPPSPLPPGSPPSAANIINRKRHRALCKPASIATSERHPRCHEPSGIIVRTANRCTAWPDILFAVVSVSVGMCMYEYVGVRGCACVSCMCPFFSPRSFSAGPD